MALTIRLCAAMVAVAAVSACSSGGSSSSGPTSGLPDPGDIIGADPDYIASLESELRIARSSIVTAGRTDLPASGSATYSGFGSIFDSSLTSADNRASDLRRRSVVTDVTGSVDFDARTVSITQDNFRDVDGKSVAGDLTWDGTYQGDGLFRATVRGEVQGTRIGTRDGSVGFFGDQNDGAVLGVFQNATARGTGWLRASRVSGDFAATKD